MSWVNFWAGKMHRSFVRIFSYLNTLAVNDKYIIKFRLNHTEYYIISSDTKFSQTRKVSKYAVGRGKGCFSV